MRLERTEIRPFHEISLKLEDRVTLFSWSVSYCLGFPGGSAGKESACNAGDLGSIPGLGRSPGEGKGYPTPVFWPGEFHGLYSPWGHKESDMTEQLSLLKQFIKIILEDNEG